MPKSLVFGGIAAVIVLVVVMTWLNNRSLEPSPASKTQEASASAPTAAPPKQVAAPAPAPAATAQGPVVLAATGPAWIQVTDQGKTLFEAELQAGQTYTVPSTAVAPMLKAGKPEALNVTVGGAAAPAVGPPGKVVTVSLAPASLMKGPAARAETPQAHRAAPASSAPAPAAAPLVGNSAQ
jgi:hypothetical protein